MNEKNATLKNKNERSLTFFVLKTWYACIAHPELSIIMENKPKISIIFIFPSPF
ncbi:MAG: hypothetical protein ACOCSL_00735 [Thermoplasmatota archaeon]